MPEHTFAAFLQRAVKQSGKSLDQIVQALKRKGCKLNKSTLSRWQNGRSNPSWKNLDALQHLPAILRMSTADRATYHHLLSQIIGGYQTPYSQSAIPQRVRFLGGELIYFEGREQELEGVETAVSKRQSILISGLGGIGKTSLARKILQDNYHRFIHGCDAIQIAPSHHKTGILHHICQQLNAPITSQTIRQNPQAALDELRLWASSIDLLFLLDNVAHAGQIQELLSSLPNITWIITSRQTLFLPQNPGLQTLNLTVPHTDAATNMLLHYAHVPNTKDNTVSAGKIASRLGNYPIALHTTSALITSGQLTSLPQLEQWLALNHITSLKIEQWEIRNFFEHLLTHIQPKEVHDLLTLCGAFPEPLINIEAFKQIAITLKLPAQKQDKLIKASLIQQNPDETAYTLHPLIHEYAQYRLRQHSKQDDMRRAFTHYYARLADKYRGKPVELESHITNVFVAAQYAYHTKNWEHLRLLWGPITGYLWLQSRWEDYLEFDQKCLEVAQLARDLPHQARILGEIAWVNYEQGHWNTAISLCHKAKALHDQLNDAKGQIRIRRYLGILFIEKRDLVAASQHLTEANELIKRIDQKSETNEIWRILQQALIYHAQAEIAQLNDDLETAVSHSQNALQLSQTTPNTRITTIIQLRLGDLLFRQRNISEAGRIWQNLATNPQSAEHLEKRILAGAQFRMAQLTASQSQYEQALHWANLAKNVYTECGHIDKRQKVGSFATQIKNPTTPFSFQDIELWD